MKTKHTQGEWTVYEERTIKMDEDKDVDLWEHQYVNRLDDEELKANAKLIATAPDLLEALINILPNYNTYVPLSNKSSKLYREALKAIEKATE